MRALLPESLLFSTAEAEAVLRLLPQRQRAVFALFGDEGNEPYVGVATDLKRRLTRLLTADTAHPRRLQLAARVRRIAWRVVGSAFEAQAVQFRLLEEIYGERALERMHLRAPAFVRFHGSNAHPRLSIATRLPREHAEWFFGPFASRAAAERYCEEVLKLFLLRRCEENLNPDPSHPGCVYSEMKKCLAPCFGGCTDARYAEEAAAVREFLATRGESRLRVLASERDAASERLEFEHAAALHAAVRQAESVRALAAEMVQPFGQLRACVMLPAAELDAVAVFLFAHGRLCGPEFFSTLGMRIQNEASGSSSLFAQPVMIEAVPLEPALDAGDGENKTAGARAASRDALVARLEETLRRLECEAAAESGSARRVGDVALLGRWYYRPAQQRVGEIFFAEPGGDANGEGWNRKAMLRGIGRVAAAQMAQRAHEAGAQATDQGADRAQ